MHRTSSRVLLIVAAFVLLLVPVAAIAAGGFTDVDDDSVFKNDIQWLADADVTKGCNPPTNDKFCPGSTVTREQMAAFMHRLAVNKVVDAKTAMDADKLDGKDSTAFAASGHDHDTTYLAKTGKAVDADKLDGMDSTAFMTKAAYDADTDGIVDSAEIVFRYAHDGFYVDVAGVVGDAMECETEPVTFDGITTVVATGGLSLEPLGTSAMPIYGEVVFRHDGETNWWVPATSEIQATPPGGTGAAAVPVNTTFLLDAGAYVFAIYAHGQNVQVAQVDYYGSCVLTVTAYTGLGPSADLATTGITSMEASAGS